MGRRYSREEWSSWIGEQEGSSLSVVEFCRRKKLSEKSFYLWRRKLRGEQRPGQGMAAESFLPVSIVETASIEITLPCGATVRLPNDEALLQRVLKLLLELGTPS